MHGHQALFWIHLSDKIKYLRFTILSTTTFLIQDAIIQSKSVTEKKERNSVCILQIDSKCQLVFSLKTERD